MAASLSRQVPIQEGLFTWPSDDPRLIASKCKECGDVMFPRQASCSRCSSPSVGEIHLSKRGSVWTFTIQNFPPPIPPYAGSGDRDTFVPYGVAYIELPEGIRVRRSGDVFLVEPCRPADGFDPGGDATVLERD